MALFKVLIPYPIYLKEIVGIIHDKNNKEEEEILLQSDGT
jgi:hypothetical protein